MKLASVTKRIKNFDFWVGFFFAGLVISLVGGATGNQYISFAGIANILLSLTGFLILGIANLQKRLRNRAWERYVFSRGPDHAPDSEDD